MQCESCIICVYDELFGWNGVFFVCDWWLRKVDWLGSKVSECVFVYFVVLLPLNCFKIKMKFHNTLYLSMASN